MYLFRRVSYCGHSTIFPSLMPEHAVHEIEMKEQQHISAAAIAVNTFHANTLINKNNTRKVRVVYY
jgi:hypothetical protein